MRFRFLSTIASSSSFTPDEVALDDMNTQIDSVDRKPITADQLRHNRLRLGWSREQLGHRIGVDADTISLWEQGSLEISCPIVLDQIFRSHEVHYARRRPAGDEAVALKLRADGPR